MTRTATSKVPLVGASGRLLVVRTVGLLAGLAALTPEVAAQTLGDLKDAVG